MQLLILQSILLVLIWVLIAEVAAAALGLEGLTILGPRLLPLSLLLFVAMALLLYNLRVGWFLVALSALPGVLTFVGLAVWRQRNRRVETLFMPGSRQGRRIEEVAIPITEGPMPAVLVKPEPGSSIGVLIVHGAGNHKSFFAWPLLHGLADAGFAACAIDVDGHGDNPRWLDFPNVLDNVSAGVNWLRQRYKYVAVLGISQGGCIAARAVAEGVAVDAVLLLETPISVAVTKHVRRSEMRIIGHPAALALHREVGTLGIVRSWQTKPTRTKIGTIDLIERLDILSSVAKITAPLFLCYGASDAVVPLTQAKRVAACAPAETTFVIVPRATHLSLSIDRRVIKQLTRWLHATLVAQ